MLNKKRLFETVFAPTEKDTVVVLCDTPHGNIKDHDDWKERRDMAEEWRCAFKDFPVHVLPLLTYLATGANNGELPETGIQDGKPVQIKDILSKCTIVLAMTQYSATAPLSQFAREHKGLRVASMPGVLRRMEQTALAADIRVVAERTHQLAALLTQAESATVLFSSEDRAFFDLRNRTGHADDGLCLPGKEFPLINMPSGEAFIVPYEGELENTPSKTEGIIPLSIKGEVIKLRIHENQITEVLGSGHEALKFTAHLDKDLARRNIAELGLGCNDRAVVRGAVIEDEKAGFHWAYGRSEHLGGIIGPDHFSAPENIIHQDVVYAPESPIGIKTMTLNFPDGKSLEIIRDNKYIVFEQGPAK